MYSMHGIPLQQRIMLDNVLHVPAFRSEMNSVSSIIEYAP